MKTVSLTMETMTAMIQHGHATVDGVNIHFAEAGTGPAVIFCHGFPELWYSWRHQLSAFAAAGYRAIALDMRGHGQSDAPDAIDAYNVFYTVGDLVGVMDALDVDKAILVGHDAGTTATYHCALMRPDRVLGVAGLAVPYIPRGPRSLLEAFAGVVPAGFYMNYFQRPGVAEADLWADPRLSLSRLIYANSGENPAGPIVMIVPDGGTLIGTLPSPPEPMAFLSDAELDVYVDAYGHTGFSGGLNGYRVFHRNWELTAPWNGMALPVPTCFIGGTKDTVLHFPGFRAAAEAMGDATFLEGAGHWIQAERPGAVNAALLAFAARVRR